MTEEQEEKFWIWFGRAVLIVGVVDVIFYCIRYAGELEGLLNKFTK